LAGQRAWSTVNSPIDFFYSSFDPLTREDHFFSSISLGFRLLLSFITVSSSSFLLIFLSHPSFCLCTQGADFTKMPLLTFQHFFSLFSSFPCDFFFFFSFPALLLPCMGFLQFFYFNCREGKEATRPWTVETRCGMAGGVRCCLRTGQIWQGASSKAGIHGLMAAQFGSTTALLCRCGLEFARAVASKLGRGTGDRNPGWARFFFLFFYSFLFSTTFFLFYFHFSSNLFSFFFLSASFSSLAVDRRGHGEVG
jgi:hypothetical protein